MNGFTLKIIALVTMFIDHIAAAFPHIFHPDFRLIGRLSFPIFAFLIAEGFRRTRDPKKFVIRLAIFALISEVPFDWTFPRGLEPWHVNPFYNTNIFVTLTLAGIGIYLYKKMQPEWGWVALMPGTAAALIANVLGSDFAAPGVILIMAMYLIPNKKYIIPVMIGFCVLQFGGFYSGVLRFVSAYSFYTAMSFYGDQIWHGILMTLATLLAVLFMLSYNGKRGPGWKWFFYAAYPAHLLVLGVLVSLGVFV